MAKRYVVPRARYNDLLELYKKTEAELSELKERNNSLASAVEAKQNVLNQLTECVNQRLEAMARLEEKIDWVRVYSRSIRKSDPALADMLDRLLK